MGGIATAVAKAATSKLVNNNQVPPHKHPDSQTSSDQQWDTNKLLPPEDFNRGMSFQQRNFAWMQEKMHAKALAEREQNLENA